MEPGPQMEQLNTRMLHEAIIWAVREPYQEEMRSECSELVIIREHHLGSRRQKESLRTLVTSLLKSL